MPLIVKCAIIGTVKKKKTKKPQPHRLGEEGRKLSVSWQFEPEGDYHTGLWSEV